MPPLPVHIPPALQQELLWWPPRQRGALFGRLRTLAEALARYNQALSEREAPPPPRALTLYLGRLCAHVTLGAGGVEVRALGQVSVLPPCPRCPLPS